MKTFEVSLIGPIYDYDDHVTCRNCSGTEFYAKVRKGTNFSDAVCARCNNPSGFTTKGESIKLALNRKKQQQAIAAGRPHDDWQQRIKLMMEE